MMKKIAFILYPGITALDLIGVYDPLTRLKNMGFLPELEWDFCSIHESVSDSFGLAFQINRNPDSLAEYDLIVIPGGLGARKVIQEPRFIQWIQSASPTCTIASVCTGALILAASGLLEGKQATTHPSARTQLEHMGEIRLSQERVVEDGRILTAGGVTAGIDLGLFLVHKFGGVDAAQKIRAQMDYPYSAQPSLLVSNRSSRIQRETKETHIRIELELDGTGRHNIQTGLPFFDHMLTQVAVHGLFNLSIDAQGDLDVDPHHTVEDVGIALGLAFAEASGDRKGIIRMASASCPMDESLAQVVVDFSGRPYAIIQIPWTTPQVGGIPTSLFNHFFESLAFQARCNLHIQAPYGRDDHHLVEACFKALARAFSTALRIDPARSGQIPSSKGSL